MTEPETSASSVSETAVGKLVEKWSGAMEANRKSSLRLEASGLFEQAVGCSKDNQLIDRFIVDLQSLQH